jgi:hypothetical protein
MSKKQSRSKTQHGFKDPGPEIDSEDFRTATIHRAPEAYLAEKFLEAGATYGGPISPRFREVLNMLLGPDPDAKPKKPSAIAAE